MSDRRLNEAAERLYDRARTHGATHGEAQRRVAQATTDVSRRVDAGKIIHPSDREKTP